MKNTATTFFVYFLFVCATIAQEADSIDRYLQAQFKADQPGVSVLVVKDGKTVLRKAYGLADVQQKTSNTSETIFRIGSITKQFTAAAILKLAESGKLSVDDPLTKYFPDFPTGGNTVTIRHLLTHTSGIYSYTSMSTLMTKEGKAKKYTTNEMLDIIKSQPFDFKPGDKYAYNNSGFYILGMIVEKVSGESWGTFLHKNFFKPLKMDRTFADDGFNYPKAKGYVNSGQITEADYVDSSMPYAAGSIYSTVDDLWKWNKALFQYKVLKRETLELAWTPAVLNDGTKQNYGFGWGLERIGKSRVISHGGAIDGFVSYALYNEDEKLFVTVLTNGAPVSPGEIAYEVAYRVLNIKKPAPITLDENTLKEYCGVYEINENQFRQISLEGGKLFSQRSGGSKLEILASAKDEFFFTNTNSTIKFVRDAQGKVSGMELTGREYLVPFCKKTDRADLSRKEIQLDTTVFDQYIGQYELVPNFILTIKRDGTRFTSQATGQQVLEIFPESETKFFLKVVDAQLEFKKNDKGEVDAVVLYQSGREMRAKRISSEASRERVAITLTSEILDKYVGRYELRPGLIAEFRRDQDKFFTQLTGQPPIEIFAETQSKFFSKIVDAQFEFFKDDKGVVSGLKITQGPSILEGKKL